jgi:hypothetical protein
MKAMSKKTLNSSTKKRNKMLDDYIKIFLETAILKSFLPGDSNSDYENHIVRINSLNRNIASASEQNNSNEQEPKTGSDGEINAPEQAYSLTTISRKLRGGPARPSRKRV